MKGYRDNGGGAGGFGARNKTVYDDVFGGPPKFGATTLPPRLEDYTEIFQGFHASRGSSIPVLDLPPPSDDSDDVWFDVRSSKLDYSEVFGGFNGLDFAVSYEEMFKSSKVGEDDSSDDVWTPAQSESLSDESDPYASLEMNQQVSAADPSQLFGVKSQKEPNLEAKRDMRNEMTNEPQCLDVRGSTVLDNQALPSKLENENFFSLADNDLCASKDYGEVVAEGKKLKKSLSQPLDSVCGTERYEIQKDYHVGNRPLLSMSDLSLKTQPSHLPPPSRPPPALTSKKGDTSNFNSTLKTSKSYAFERMTGGQSPPYFDVEIDASSSAAADAAAMKDAVEQAQAKLKSAKELMDRKKEGLQSRLKMRMENNVGDKKVRINDDHEKLNGSTSLERDNAIKEENQKEAGIFEPNASFMRPKKNNNAVLESFTVLESFGQKEDSKTVQERELCGSVENNERQETLDTSVPTVAQITCTMGEMEKRAFVSPQHADMKTPNDSDENESYENLIEIQLKDNDMETVERVVTENWFKNDDGRKGDDDMGPACYVWEDYDVGLEESVEKEYQKGVKVIKEQDEKEIQQSSSPEISMVQSEEEDHHNREEVERLVEAFEQEESDNISETASEQDENIKEQTLDHNDKILLEEDKIKAERDDNLQKLNHAGANENVNIIHDVGCNSDEDRKLPEWDEEESENGETAILENDGIENELSTSENLETSDLVFQVDDNEILQATRDVQHDKPFKKHEPTPETPCLEKIKETVEQIHDVVKESSNQNDLQGVKVELRTDVTYSNLSTNESAGKTYSDNVIGLAPIENEKRTFVPKNGNNVASNQAGFHPEERTTTKTSTTIKPVMVQADPLRNSSTTSKVAVGSIERKAVLENRGKEERLPRVRELENERLRKIEEERERQIEREKDRMAVDRATLEAREKAFAETRERAERAAVERATAEFRQRALAEARERLEKACAEARERSLADKAMEGRLRVEKATAEARERAERSVTDKYSAYQITGIRQNSLPSDLARSYSGLRYSQAAAQSGEGESPQRCKARLERHQRTADRAAKALAEKNMRDLIAQKEQAERSRLAEGLDAEVKRWSSGKQGNLRALLSTLQYILGPDSGWQPVPLTEVITTAAVKKAYRKATLCVHPDKLQQRGATIQQKYICEKVFDLLKEAWNKFNSEER